ncbi:hypothetical protein JQ615_39500 [Bradyrhizobium jicamae]|uniref:Uncharacterized protein n=1 Tax=Bradyrhizobium jicamae TaxID=280332 RepID=A0ABS5FXD5_9BRAD|nr:hypothetical protein [Bradyrhizobium jicamae]MBR0801447.1 hypothetical protein [Bradyrhizobium jicamae]MBR0938991.1 hypothetical protein [Bradyrhizobium jicamae]
MTDQEGREQDFDDLRRCGHAKNSNFTTLELARPLMPRDHLRGRNTV